MFELLPGVGAVPVILAVVQLAKKLGFAEKHSPLLAVVLGQIFALGVFFYGDSALYEAVIMGILSSAAAVGVYSGVKNETEAFRGY